MATLTINQNGVGKASKSPVVAFADGTLKFATATFAFDNSYPTGGESISSLTGLFRQCLGVICTNSPLSAGTGKEVVIDLANSKAMLVTNAATPAEVANGSDQSGMTNIVLLAFGY